MYQDHPSLFLYAVLNAPLGGPSFFFVTGLAAGFGYNRRLNTPTIEEVATFPLVAQAVGGVPQEAAKIHDLMHSLSIYLPPAVGEYFLAVGIKFTSFKLIDSFALLLVSLGKSLEVNALGLSTLVQPPQVGEVVPPLVLVQMALKASFVPAVGFLGVEAKLTSASFLFARECHLTGGFAFYSWFAGVHQNDFALTLGGYHPAYVPPAHFPVADPLGFNWVISPQLSVKGEAYCALVPSAVMAGVHLNALWQDGNLRAWFQATADFVMAWKPYHYDARLRVSLGVDYTFELFGTHHLSVEAGADLHLWGPEFTGTAQAHLWIISFDIQFGHSSSTAPQSIGWPEFALGFLPVHADGSDEVCSLSVTAGLEKQAGRGTTAQPVINPKTGTLRFSTQIPLKGPEPGAARAVTDGLAGAAFSTQWGIAPMNLRQREVDSRFTLRISHEQEDVTDQFRFAPVYNDVPTALWGETVAPDLNGPRLVERVLCGLDVQVAPPQELEHIWLNADDLLIRTDTLPSPAWQWADLQPLQPTPLNEPERWAALHAHLATGHEQRTALLRQLGFAADYPTDGLAAAFVEAPQLVE
jgi:hypothetical protein